MKKIYTFFLLVTIINVHAQVPSYVPTSSLVAWYSFNGNANDLSGNTNTLTVNGATLTTDRCGSFNSAYFLDGINDNLETATNFYNPSVPHSVSIWWKTSDSTKTDQTLFNTNPHTTENLAFRYNGTASPPYGLAFGLGDGTVGTWTIMHPNSGQFTITPNFNKWHLSVLVRNSSAWTFYQDGAAVYTFTSGLNTTPTNATLRFGAENNGGPGAQFKGSIDDIGIWNKALTPTEVAALFNVCGVGINEIQNPNAFSIYPNPASNILNIESKWNDKIENVILFDLIGRKVLEQKENASQINIQTLEKGMYQFQIISEGKNYSGKFIKE